MDSRELIAAAGMLPTLPIPGSRAEGGSGPVTEAEGAAIRARRQSHHRSVSIRVRGARSRSVRGASWPRHSAAIALARLDRLIISARGNKGITAEWSRSGVDKI
jgi:hypothetical protein